MNLRIGTRGSPLARWQANWVAEQLRAFGHDIELVPISTRGDRVQTGPIAAIAGGDGVFTKELQRALLADEIDVAVHSLKDLPTAAVEGLALAAVPRRGPTGDLLIVRNGGDLNSVPQEATIGTGSLRRRTQLWHARPDLKMADVRGNIDTRLRKLADGAYDALCLAEAGLKRLEIETSAQVLPRSIMLPAVGQGALGLEARAGDAAVAEALAALDDVATHAAVLAERAMLQTIGGGCLAPIGAWGRVEADGLLHLDAVVLSMDGRTRLSAADAAPPARAVALGEKLAAVLSDQGAAALIEECRRAQS
jgi:hydroxymethylbilane synthase